MQSIFLRCMAFQLCGGFFVRTVSISPQIAIIFYIFCTKINKNHKIVSQKRRKDSVKVLYFFSKHGIIIIRQRHCRRSEPVTTKHKKTNMLHSAEKRGAYENTHHCRFFYFCFIYSDTACCVTLRVKVNKKCFLSF